MSDPLFQGLTRPAMLLGVPLTPLIVVGMFFMFLAIFFTFWWLGALVPVVFIMRLIVSEDDRAFHIMWLNLQAKAPAVGKRKLGKAHVYSPFAKKDLKNGK